MITLFWNILTVVGIYITFLFAKGWSRKDDHMDIGATILIIWSIILIARETTKYPGLTLNLRLDLFYIFFFFSVSLKLFLKLVDNYEKRKEAKINPTQPEHIPDNGIPTYPNGLIIFLFIVSSFFFVLSIYGLYNR